MTTSPPPRRHDHRRPHRPPPTPTPPLRVSGPAELLAAVPAMLGFVPEHSVVVVGLTGPGGRRLGLAARADLPGPADQAAVGEQLARAVRSTGAVAAVVVLVDPAPAPLAGDGRPHEGLVAALVGALGDGGVGCTDVLGADRLTAGGVWWVRHPDGTDTPGGVLADPWSSAVAAAHVVAGRVMHADRAALTAVLAPHPGAGDPALAAAVDDAVHAARRRRSRGPVRDGSRAALAQVLAAVARCEDGVVPEGPELAALAGALDDVAVRDACVALAVSDHADAAERLWAHVARSLPPRWRAEPACLLAVGCYARGEGPLAGVALDVALGADPTHRLARMLRDGLDAALPPSEVRELSRQAGELAARLGVEV